MTYVKVIDENGNIVLVHESQVSKLLSQTQTAKPATSAASTPSQPVPKKTKTHDGSSTGGALAQEVLKKFKGVRSSSQLAAKVATGEMIKVKAAGKTLNVSDAFIYRHILNKTLIAETSYDARNGCGIYIDKASVDKLLDTLTTPSK